MKAPSNNILILSAICLSIIAGLGAYKIGEARKIVLSEKQKNTAVFIDVEKTNSETEVLQSALKKISLDATLNTSDDSNPFEVKDTDTYTDKLAKNIFVSYAEREAGKSTADDETVANNILQTIDTSILPQASFSLGDIKIFAPRTKEEIKKYGNEAGQAIKTHYETIAGRGVKEDDLRKIAELHKKIGEDLVKISVPAPITQAHLSLANSFVMFADSLLLISDEESRDPLKALLAVRTAKDSSETMSDAIAQINTYLDKSAILYYENEPGLIWARLISYE